MALSFAPEHRQRNLRSARSLDSDSFNSQIVVQVGARTFRPRVSTRGENLDVLALSIRVEENVRSFAFGQHALQTVSIHAGRMPGRQAGSLPHYLAQLWQPQKTQLFTTPSQSSRVNRLSTSRQMFRAFLFCNSTGNVASGKF